MNKQEAINELKKYKVGFGEAAAVRFDRIVSVINQIHEPQKVVIPEFVALRIEKYKDSNKSLYQLLDLSDDKEFNDWFLPNREVDASRCDVLARAWLDGFEIEQEKLYVVTDGNKLYLKEFDELNAIIIIDDVVGAVDYAKRYDDKTEAQKAADELGWVAKEVE
ncbi:DUF1642 domain-containing protein [Streptococcus suis]|nr:DUF1642 domain-containing protein [Streptococcus suis]